MEDQFIICPYCKNQILLTEAITSQIREKIQKEFDDEIKKKNQEIAKKEEKLSLKEKELEKSRKSIEEQVAEKVKLETEKIEIELKKNAEESVVLELSDLKEQIKEKNEKLQEFVKAELDFRKKYRKLEEDKKIFELEMNRKLDKGREKIKESAIKSVQEEYRLKDKEKEKQISDMKKQIEELKRKAEQGSQQMQGEVFEIELEEILISNFPYDSIEPVPKGIRGADVLQKIHSQSGQCCGTIVWETKRAKNWNNDWITKLKDDQRTVKAEIAVLLTTVLPNAVSNFSYIDGVWVTNYDLIVGLATALRINLIQVANIKLASIGKNEKMEELYNYLSGPIFRQKIEGILEAFSNMKKELDHEKRVVTTIWAKREKQIERVLNNTAVMYGDMKGIITSLPEIESLELKSLAPASDELKNGEED